MGICEGVGEGSVVDNGLPNWSSVSSVTSSTDKVAVTKLLTLCRSQVNKWTSIELSYLCITNPHNSNLLPPSHPPTGVQATANSHQSTISPTYRHPDYC